MKRNGIELSNPVIEVDDLCKQVALADGQGELRILQDIRFAVGAGESVAIVGASGSGKSTLLGLLAGLDVPAHGTVRVQGRDLFALDEDARAALAISDRGYVLAEGREQVSGDAAALLADPEVGALYLGAKRGLM